MNVNDNTYDVLVVGAGMAGLTASAYLAKTGFRVLICERAEKPGGLVADFTRHGFRFDAGLRAVENSGVIRPMLRDLGIELEFLENPVSIRIGDETVRLQEGGLEKYASMLQRVFPENVRDIQAIQREILQVSRIMDVLYGIDNPLFMNLKSNPRYLLHTILPWLLRYKVNMRKVRRFRQPIEQHLARLTDNKALIDMIAQHFFRNTPGFFALSYFGLYMDYMYPKGGTGALARAMADFLRMHGGEIRCGTEIVGIHPEARSATASDGRKVGYQKLVWAADMKSLYRAAGTLTHMTRSYRVQAERVAWGRGGDSVLTVFLELDIDPREAAEAFGAHCFYTPATEGLSSLGLDSWAAHADDANCEDRRVALEDWLRRYFALTTYEISCPVIRDASLAPEGRTGLIVSTLFDVDLARRIQQFGWYAQFKELCVRQITAQLEKALPRVGERLVDFLCATPLTIEKLTGNTDGAITGWSFCGEAPAESRFQKIAKSVFTPIPHVFQAGQWTFSPSGLPVSVLTGKLAADAVRKEMMREKS